MTLIDNHFGQRKKFVLEEVLRMVLNRSNTRNPSFIGRKLPEQHKSPSIENDDPFLSFPKNDGYRSCRMIRTRQPNLRVISTVAVEVAANRSVHSVITKLRPSSIEFPWKRYFMVSYFTSHDCSHLSTTMYPINITCGS